MPIRRGFFGGSVNLLPTASVTSADQNQQAAYLYGTVNAQGASTSVVFDYSTSSSFSSYSTVTASPGTVTGFGNTGVSVFISGLPNATTYYYRIRATSSIGTTTSGTGSFKTWGLIQWANGTPGTYGLSIPVGAGQAPVLRYVFLFGGGGGAGYGGGGGGGYRLRDTYAFSAANGSMTVVVGGGGGAQAGGGTSYITGSYLSTLDAGGGGGGSPAVGGNGGGVGYGDNPGYGGGTGFAFYNKDGSLCCFADGGGGGIGGGGGNNQGDGYVGGAGGTGGSAYGWNGGAGGGGYGTSGYGGNGAYHGWGSGGQGVNNGGSNGLVTFYYYGNV
jgi:hypothetical protein